MTTITPASEGADQLGLPWDLTEWVSAEDLLRWIDEDVATLDWNNPTLVAFLQAHPDFKPKAMLRLLTFAYATGFYSSEDIVQNSYRDKNFFSICEDGVPRSKEIIAFRRENRALLKWFLVQLFKRALRVKFNLGDFLVPPGLKQRLAEAAVTRVDIARHLDRGEQSF